MFTTGLWCNQGHNRFRVTEFKWLGALKLYNEEGWAGVEKLQTRQVTKILNMDRERVANFWKNGGNSVHGLQYFGYVYLNLELVAFFFEISNMLLTVYKLNTTIFNYFITKKNLAKNKQKTDILPNQELSVLYGGPTLNYGRQLFLYFPHMLRVNMTRDLAHLQLSDL